MKRNKLFKFLASLKLAVVLFVMFSIILALATYYESVYDTETAQHLVYKSPLFAVFLSLFFLNIWCSTAIRFPWKRKQLGFVITHVGILMLLASSAFTMVGGVDGSMLIQEGQTSSRVLLNQPVFFVGPPSKDMREIPAEFRWRPPTVERPARVELGEGITAVVEQYLHHARMDKFYEESKDAGVPALEMRIFNKRVNQREWLTVGKGDLNMGPARIRMLRASTEEHLQTLLAPGSNDQGEIQVLAADDPFQVKVSELTQGVPLKVGAFKVELKRYLPHAVAENNKLVSKSNRPINPCVELRVSDDAGDWQDWLLFARLPELNAPTGSHGARMPIRLMYVWDGEEEAEQPQRTLSFIWGPKGELYSKVDNQPARLAPVGKPVTTGWMDLQYEILRVIPRATERREFVGVEVAKGNEKNAPPPAIKVRFEGAKENKTYWLERGDVEQIHTASGQPLVVGYAYKSIEVGFPVRLKDFQIDYDPGTRSPAAFRSKVEVEGQELTIQMNEPMTRNGFRFFQSSYSEIPGQPSVSIFTVSKDPGILLKYGGSIMMVVGIAIMFYMRPYQGGSRKPKVAQESKT